MLDSKPKSTRIHDDIFYHMEIIMEKAADVCGDLLRYIANSENPEGPENEEVWDAFRKVRKARDEILRIESEHELYEIKDLVDKTRVFYNNLQKMDNER